MVNTVLGKICPTELGVTLMHEHIIWDWEGAKNNKDKEYSIEDIVNTMEPYLLDLKKLGCRTLVEGTTYGAGRDVEVLKECSKRTGLNIITNCGAWDGGKHRGKFVPDEIKDKSIGEVKDTKLRSYNNIFTKFIPICKSKGILEEVINKILIENPAKVLNVDFM